MKNFCASCPHKDIDEGLKIMFNTYASNKDFFIECPIKKESDLSGCVRKYISIDWDKFVKWLEENELVSGD